MLAAIEMHLFHGSRIVSLPITSVIDELHSILQYYERLGFVRLTDGIVLPELVSVDSQNKTRCVFIA